LVYWQFITGKYNGKNDSIDIWARSDQDEKKKLSIMGFEPYMYVPASDKVPESADWIRRVEQGYVSMLNENLQKIVVTDPLMVRDHRSDFTKHYEADINFIQRFLIDTDIWSCFETNSRNTTIPYTQLKKVDKIISPLVVFMDIEVRVKGRFPNPRVPTNPVIACTFWNSRNKIYITLVYDDRYKVDAQVQVSDTWHVWYYTTPEKVGYAIREYLEFIKPDIITGWNIRFDWEYYNAWAKWALHSTLDLQDIGAELFDLLEGYKKAKPDLGFRLKEVVVREGIIRPKDMISESFAIEMYEDKTTRDNFITYNKKDVEYCVKLDRGFVQVETGEYIQYNFIEDYWNQKNFVGLADINYTLLHTKRHDPLWLRMAHKLRIVLPSQPESGEEEEGLEYGGVVFNPPVGIYPDLTIVDMSRYYPTILLSFPKETSPDIWGLIGVAVITFLSDERTKWDNEVKKYKQGTSEYTIAKLHQTVAKAFLSGAWGYFASPISRIYSKEKADFVLKTAGTGLVRMRDKATQIGHTTRYGDSVSSDTPVLVNKNEKTEYVPIEDVFIAPLTTFESHFDVKGLKILSDNGWSVIKHIYRHKVKKKMYRILTRESYIECTEDHSLVINGKEVKPDTLSIGDKIDLVSVPILEENEVDGDIAWLVGFYLAEGSCFGFKEEYGLKRIWKISNPDEALLFKCKEILHNKLGLETKILDTMMSSNVFTLVPIGNQKAVYELFKVWCHTKTGRKKIPSFILNGNKKQEFINGLWDGDGSQDKCTKILKISLEDKCIVSGLCELLKSVGNMYSLGIRGDKPNIIRLKIIRDKSDARIKAGNIIKKIVDFTTNAYVYDVETENHHFVGGIGNVLLHNTDSVFIEAQMEEVDSLVTNLNEELKIWADEMGITETARFKIKEDRYAKATLFLPFEKAQRGVKKHYAQWIIREGDKPVDYILIKGLEAVRGNTSEITRKVQKEVLEAVLRGNTGGLIDRLQGLVKGIKTNVFELDDITIPVNLSLDFIGKDIKQEYYVGAYYNNAYLKEGIIPEDHVRFFKVKSTGSLPSTRWVSYLDSSVITKNNIIPDYDWIIDRTLRSPCERILQAVGISWDNIEGFKNASDIFA